MSLDHLKRKPAAGGPAPKPTAKPLAMPTVTKPTVQYRCGHSKPIAELAGQDCPTCRNTARAAKNKARHQARSAKPVAGDPNVFRFPPGTGFGSVIWDGSEWQATLYVPDPANSGLSIFSASASGTAVEHVLRDLKQQYVASLTPPTV